MSEEIIISDECEFCFMHNSDSGSCCAVKKEDMPYNCPRKNDLAEIDIRSMS